MADKVDLTWGIYGLPIPEYEYRFHPERKWRFDWAWPKWMVAAEQEGGIWTEGRHTRAFGFLKDMEKYNSAGRLGWRVFRFTPQEIRKGVAQEFMKGVLV